MGSKMDRNSDNSNLSQDEEKIKKAVNVVQLLKPPRCSVFQEDDDEEYDSEYESEVEDQADIF